MRLKSVSYLSDSCYYDTESVVAMCFHVKSLGCVSTATRTAKAFSKLGGCIK